MHKPRGDRFVKTAAAALARTNRPEGVRQLGDGIQNLISGIGSSRDKQSYTRYVQCGPLQQFDCDAMYDSWLFARIVDIYPDDMVRKWVDLSWDGLDKDPEQKHELTDAIDDIGLQAKIHEALKWARLYGGCLVVIGIRGQNLATPLDMRSIKKGSLQFLHVMDRWRCSPSGQLDTTPGPNFGRPVFYTLAESASRVHWTRVVRFNGRQLPYWKRQLNSGWDGSVLTPVLESVRDYETTRGAIASLIHEAKLDVISVEGFYDTMATAGGEARLAARFAGAALMKNMNGFLLIDKDKESYDQKPAQFAGLNSTLENFMTDAAGAAAIPITKLFGRSPGGLNATGEHDADNWNQTVAAEQVTSMRPQTRVLLEVAARSTLGDLPRRFKFTFNPLSELSAVNKSTIQKTNADRDKVYVDLGVLTEGAIARQLKEDNVYSTLEEDDVEMAEELSEQLVEQRAAAPAPGPPSDQPGGASENAALPANE